MNLKAIKAFLVRDVKSTFKDKAALFWIIAWPIIWILMTAYVFIPPGSGSAITLNVGVVNDDHSVAPFNGTYLIKIMNETTVDGKHLFNVKMYSSTDKLREDLSKGRLDAGLVIPDGFGRNATYGTGRLDILIRADNPSTKQINSGILSGFLQEVSRRLSMVKINISMRYIEKYMPSTQQGFSPEKIKEYLVGIAIPINTTIKEVVPVSVSSRPSLIGWYTLGAIGMMFLYTGLMIGAAMIVREKELGTLRRLLASPSSGPELLIGKTLGGIVILVISAIIALFVGLMVGARIYWNPADPIDWLVPVFMLIAAIMAIGMGLILSLVSRTSRGASSLSTALGLLFTITAGIWIPKEWLPSWMRVFAENFPFTWTIDGIRNIIVYQYGWSDIAPLLLKSLVVAIVIFAIGALIYKAQIRRYAEK
ncbi:MAG: ABC transporter permease [Crenarchaeota archaeon]|nr:ABC transporter permease [Thermoproteota archaeon]